MDTAYRPEGEARPKTPTPAGSSSNTEISDLFSRLSLVKFSEPEPEPQKIIVLNELQADPCHFCSNSQEATSNDQTCLCHRYSCVFDQSSGLLNDSQSTPIRDQDLCVEEPPWLFGDTQNQTQNACTMSMATLQEALKSIVISPCISEDEDVDLSCLSPARISLLPPLARSISLGYIPNAFPREPIETICVPPTP